MVALIGPVTRAMLWLRVRWMLNSVRRMTRRDGLERVATVLAFVPVVLAALMLVPVVLLCTIGAGIGGFEMAQARSPNVLVITLMRIFFAVMTAAVLFGPFLRSFQGNRLDWARYRLLPIPRSTLFRSELLSTFTEPWVFGFLPPSLALIAGLLAGGALVAALWAAVLIALFFYAMSNLGALATLGAALLLRDRRRAEALGLALLMTAVLAPVALTTIDDGPESPEPAPDARAELPEPPVDARSPAATRSTPDFVFRWFRPFPSDLTATGLRAAMDPRARATALPHAAGLIAWCVVLTLLARAVFRRILADPPSSAGRRGAASERAPWTLPWIDPVVQEIARAQAKTFLRTVRGKLALLFTAPFVLLFYLGPLGRTTGVEWIEALPKGPTMFFGAVAFHALTMPALPLSTVAADGPGWTLQWLTPAGARKLVWGKLLGMTWLFLTSLGLCLAVTLFLARDGSIGLWISIVLTGVSAWALSAAPTFVLGLLLPKPIDPNQLGKAGNPHPLANLIGTLLFGAGLAPGSIVMIHAVAGNAPGPAILLRLLLWAAIAVALTVPLMHVAANLLSARFENLQAVFREG